MSSSNDAKMMLQIISWGGRLEKFSLEQHLLAEIYNYFTKNLFRSFA